MGAIKGDTRSLDYDSYGPPFKSKTEETRRTP